MNLFGSSRLRFSFSARAVRPDFTVDERNLHAVGEICRRVDGLPLAIELAAARSKVLSPPALLARLTNRLQLLTSDEQGIPERHRTLRNTIAWSYDLLTPREQRLFRRLAVFAGGFSPDAVDVVYRPLPNDVLDPSTADALSFAARDDSVALLDGLGALLDQGMIQRVNTGVETGQLRFGMLETLREWAMSMLISSGENDDIRERHARWCVSLVGVIEHRRPPQEYLQLVARLDADVDNIRSSLTWALDHEPRLALQIAVAAHRYWYMRDLTAEGQRWVEQALAAAIDATPELRVRALVSAGTLARRRALHDDAVSRLESALTLAREHGDRTGEARALAMLGGTFVESNDFARAMEIYDVLLPLARDLADSWLITGCLEDMGVIATMQREYERALPFLEETLRRRRDLKDIVLIANTLFNLGDLHRRRGDIVSAVPLLAESIALRQQLNEVSGLIESLNGYALLAVAHDAFEIAARLWGKDESLRGGIDPPIAHYTLDERTKALMKARTRLGSDRFTAAWSAGEALTTEQVVDEALRFGETIGVSALPASIASSGYGLTPRELEVLTYVVQGKSDREIGEVLFISRRTAAAHVSNILAKLGVTTRTAAAAEAVRREIVRSSRQS